LTHDDLGHLWSFMAVLPGSRASFAGTGVQVRWLSALTIPELSRSLYFIAAADRFTGAEPTGRDRPDTPPGIRRGPLTQRGRRPMIATGARPPPSLLVTWLADGRARVRKLLWLSGEISQDRRAFSGHTPTRCAWTVKSNVSPPSVAVPVHVALVGPP
jgi:hypothetical protein